MGPEYVKSALQAITKQQATGQKSRQSPGRQFTERMPNGHEPHRNVPGLIANREVCVSHSEPRRSGWVGKEAPQTRPAVGGGEPADAEYKLGGPLWEAF